MRRTLYRLAGIAWALSSLVVLEYARVAWRLAGLYDAFGSLLMLNWLAVLVGLGAGSGLVMLWERGEARREAGD